jgi:hypothetical protein
MPINMPMSIVAEACAAKWSGITYCPEPSPWYSVTGERRVLFVTSGSERRKFLTP